ncbi:Type I restriction modification DNA specificity domain protein [anaerobic digester metagenome]
MNTTKPLGEIVTFVGGGTPDKKNPDYWNGGIPWASVKDLNCRILAKTVDNISEEGVQNSATKIIPKGNIIMATRMALGKAVINEIDVAINQDLKAVYCSDEVYPPYLYHFINANSAYIESLGKGATVKGITLSVLKEIEVPLPPLPKQKRIATILDKADSIRRKRQDAIALADTFLRSVFQKMFGDPLTNSMGWDESNIKDIATVHGGLSLSSKRNKYPIEMPYLRVANVFREYLNLAEIKTLRVTKNECDKALLRVGDILIVEGHGNKNEIGRCAVWDGSIENCLHQNHLICVRVDKTKTTPEFVSYYINSQAGRMQMLRSGRTTSGLNTISISKVKETKLVVPPIDLQENFSKICQHFATRTLREFKLQNSNAEILFSSLQQRAFRGDL